jgi:predicted component of type VI protein secretion system
MSLNAKLVVVGGDVKTTEIKLRLPSTVGRGRGTTIMLPHPLVSRQHCELFESNGQLMVRDLGSLNGTFVNNQRITESPLPPGELLTIGTVTFRAMYDAQPDSQPPGGAAPQVRGRRNETDAATLPAPVLPRSGTPGNGEPLDVGDFEMAEEVQVEELNGAPHKTEQAPATPAAGSPVKTATVSSVKTTPAPAKGARPAAPATDAKGTGPQDDDVDFSKWQDDDDEPVKTDDDDLGDFLKSLGK